MRYLKSALNTLKKEWGKLVVITLLGVLALSAVGYLKAKKDITGEAERRERIETYLSQVETYKAAVEDSKRAVKEAEEQHAAIQDYVDNSIYMNLDGENAWVGSVQFGVVAQEWADVENILNALQLYVTQGGLKKDVGEDQEELGVKYWGEVVGVTIQGKTFSVTITQTTEEKAGRSIEIIKERILAQVPSIAESFGGFRLAEQGTSVYKISDLNIANNQNAKRDQLKSYELNHSDLETRAFNMQNDLTNYIENNRPDSLEVETASMKKTVGTFALVGLLLGFWIALGIVLFDYIAGNRMKTEEDLKKLDLEILGIHNLKKGFIPDAAKTAVDITGLLINKESLPLLDAPAKDGVALYDVARSSDTEKVCETYLAALQENGCLSSYVDASANGADPLKELLSRRSAVIIASAGDTRIEKIQEALRKFEHYGIHCLGAIVLK